MKKKINPVEITAEKRQEEFLKVFRRFDSIGEGAEYIAQATGCVVGTVMVWRCKKKSGYGIPKRPFTLLMAKIEEEAKKVKK